jgi:hypothetical protein
MLIKLFKKISFLKLKIMTIGIRPKNQQLVGYLATVIFLTVIFSENWEA